MNHYSLMTIAKEHQAELRAEAQRNRLIETSRPMISHPAARELSKRLFVRIAFILIVVSLLAIYWM